MPGLLENHIAVVTGAASGIGRAIATGYAREDAQIVLLGLFRHDGRENGKLALQMDRAFGALFNTEAHLDVVFLDDAGDAEIRKNCQPFYTYTSRYH